MLKEVKKKVNMRNNNHAGYLWGPHHYFTYKDINDGLRIVLASQRYRLMVQYTGT